MVLVFAVASSSSAARLGSWLYCKDSWLVPDPAEHSLLSRGDTYLLTCCSLCHNQILPLSSSLLALKTAPAGSLPILHVLPGCCVRGGFAITNASECHLLLPALVWWEVQSLCRLPGDVPICQILPAAEFLAPVPFPESVAIPKSILESGWGAAVHTHIVSLPRKKQKRIVTCRTTERRWMGKGTLLLNHVSC